MRKRIISMLAAVLAVALTGGIVGAQIAGAAGSSNKLCAKIGPRTLAMFTGSCPTGYIPVQLSASDVYGGGSSTPVAAPPPVVVGGGAGSSAPCTFTVAGNVRGQVVTCEAPRAYHVASPTEFTETFSSTANGVPLGKTISVTPQLGLELAATGRP